MIEADKTMENLTVERLIQLMKKAKNGEKQAFENIYNYFFKPVYRYLFSRLKNTKDAEDLAQQVFLRLYTSTGEFSDQAKSPLAYLFTIARNLTNSFFKNKNQLQYIEDKDIPDNKNMEKTFEQNQTLLWGLNQLNSEQREVIEFKFKSGLTTREIATRLNKTEMTIRQIQCRALKELRQILSK